MSQPTPGDVHVNGPLSQISIAYMQNASNFVADQVFPNIPVAKQSDVFYEYDRSFFNRDEMEVRAPGTETKGIGYAVSTTPYFAPVYGIHHDIPDQVRANADSAIGPDRDATNLVSMQALLRRERQWANTFFQPATWATDVASGLAWEAAGTPIEDIRLGKRTILLATGFEPNILVLGREAADILLDNATVVDRVIYGTQQGANGGSGVSTVGIPELAALLQLDRILVMNSIENTAEEGAAESNAMIATTLDALLCYAAPSPGLMTPSAGYTFSWNGLLGSGALGSRISRFRQEAIKSDRVEIEMAFDHQIISTDLGYFFDDVTSA